MSARRRHALAGALAVLAHASLGVLVARRERVAAPPPEPALEMEIVLPVPAPAPAAAPRARTTVPALHPVAAALAPRAPTTDSAADVANEERVETESAPSGTLDLSLSALPSATRERLGGPAPPDVGRPTPRGRPSVDELRGTLERAEDAVANVERGRVDPLVYDVLRGARKRFGDEARRMAEAIAMGPGRTVSAWGRGYLNGVANRKSAGAPSPSDDALKPKVDPYTSPDLLRGYSEAQRQASAGAEERRAEVCLSLAPDRAPTASLRRGSGDAELDRLALESFTRAAEARPIPADVRPETACYELRISAYRMPPLPFLSCGLDLDGVNCAWPFKKVTDVGSHLLSVDYGASPSTSLLRRAR
jgi:hypothetical protein